VREQQSVLPNQIASRGYKDKSEEKKVAIVATARHMAKSIYWILTRKEYYKENKAIRASSFS